MNKSMTRNKMEISIDDVMNMEIETPPPLAVQENIVEDITRLMSEGKVRPKRFI
jgi:hypothetical protein